MIHRIPSPTAPLLALIALGVFGCSAPDAPAPTVEPQGTLAEDPADAPLPSALPDDEAEPEMPAIPTADEDEACQAGATRCLDEAVAQVCLRDGAWADVPCERQEACVDGPDRCLPVACEPGKIRCDGRWAQQACADDGRSWLLSDACSLTEQCTSGGCRVCAPNAGECTGEQTRRVCENDGRAWRPQEVCETGLCFQGECLVCVPGEGQCVGDTTVRRCRADGMGLEAEPTECEPGARCLDGRCRPPCRTRVLVVVDDSTAMAPYLDTVREILADVVDEGRFALGFVTARATRGCGNGVEPPQVGFAASPETARDWLTTLEGSGESQITDLVTWLQQNRDRVWPAGGDPAHMLILTASGDTCGPNGQRDRIQWNDGTYESLGGQLRGSGVLLDIVDVGGRMDGQLNRLRICNGRGPALRQEVTEAFETELHDLIAGLLRDADICER